MRLISSFDRTGFFMIGGFALIGGFWTSRHSADDEWDEDGRRTMLSPGGRLAAAAGAICVLSCEDEEEDLGDGQDTGSALGE